MIVVTAATGHVGRPLLALLIQAGARVRAVTRDATGVRLPAGVEVVEGDPSKPGTMAAALSGASSVFVNPRAVGRGVEQLVEMAREVGVGRLVTLSALNVDDDPARQPSRYRGDLNRETEAAVAGWGGEWVSLRPSVFASNSIGLWGAQVRAGNVIRGPAGRASSAPIDERDIAGVAAVALLTDTLLGRRVVLTGSEALVEEDMVACLAAALGRPLRYEHIPNNGVELAMMAQGFSAAFIDAYLDMHAAATRDKAIVTAEVERIVGRPATSYAQWARDHARAFAGLDTSPLMSGTDR